MTDTPESETSADRIAASLASAVERAEEAFAALKAALDKGGAAEIGDKVSKTASALLREGEQLIDQSETLKGAHRELSGTIRRNPLASIGVAFGAGLLVALLTRG